MAYQKAMETGQITRRSVQPVGVPGRWRNNCLNGRNGRIGNRDLFTSRKAVAHRDGNDEQRDGGDQPHTTRQCETPHRRKIYQNPGRLAGL
jgi:hypothetical protein